jgi:ABC-type transport system involved in multi-copper enzyme maturation permease subunit
MIKTFALLLDSYRELNSKRLFWIVLALSGIVVFFFAAIGLDGEAITAFGWKSPFQFAYLAMLSHATFYKILFTAFGINFWLAWLATILALVSTAGIFPDFMAGGSVDLYLSKPISRLRLFFTKYAGGLLFVTLQVTVFCVACFILLGTRGGSWEPSLFLAVPLVVLMFSYLYSICVLIGVMTRSTIAALLLTILIWGGLWAVQTTETGLLQASIADQRHAAYLDRRIADTQSDLNDLSKPGAEQPTTAPTTAPDSAAPDIDSPSAAKSWWGWLPGGSTTTSARLRKQLDDLKSEREQLPVNRFVLAHEIAYAIVFPLPKTSGTIELLTRQLVKLADLPKVNDPETSTGAADAQADEGRTNFRRRRQEQRVDARDTDIELRSRSAVWILGTSCGFEAVVLGLAAWMFCRRDY